MDTDELVILSSGAVVPEYISRDVLRADLAGGEARKDFVDNHLKSGKNFFLPAKRLNLKTLASLHKKAKMTKSNNKVVQYKQQVKSFAQLFVQCQSYCHMH